MFDSLVPEYDRFNRLGSLGMDVGWRKELAGLFRDKELVLDVGTGTGDLVKVLLQQGAKQVRGVDFSSNMIDAARWKLKTILALHSQWRGRMNCLSNLGPLTVSRRRLSFEIFIMARLWRNR
jgi:ubiquinone/menaquinone biosynthesis C-methylase UbiE